MSSDSSAPDTAAADSSKERRELLLKVYETAVAEYRFNVQLTWDRTKFFLLLTLSAITAGVGLLKVAIDNWVLCLFLAAYFGLLLRLTKFGREMQKTGKSYTRQAQLTMTLAERELGLFHPLEGLGSPDLHLGLAVTPGQRDPIAVIFKREERSQKKPDAKSVVQRVSGVFGVLMLIEGLGALICLGAAVPETVRAAMLGWVVAGAEILAAHIEAAASTLLPSGC